MRAIVGCRRERHCPDSMEGSPEAHRASLVGTANLGMEAVCFLTFEMDVCGPKPEGQPYG